MSLDTSSTRIQPTNLVETMTGDVGASVPSDQSALLAGSEEASFISLETVIIKSDRYALPRKQLLSVVTSLYMCAFLAALDATVVSTLLTIISSDLKSLDSMSWIATAYLLSCSALQPIYGKLSDIFGRKPLLIACCITFAMGCAICAIPSMALVIAGRLVAGVGGSGLTILCTITLSDLIPLRDRGVYQGYTNIFYGLGTASGGIFGGTIADWLGWKYVFLLQVPVAFAVALTIYWTLHFPKGSPGLGSPGHFREKLRRVDIQGALFLVAFLVSVLLAASEGKLSILFKIASVSSVLSLIGFIYTESNVAEEPILPISLFSMRTVVASCLTNWFYTMGVFTYLFYIPIYYSSVMSFSGTQVGLRLMPNFLGTSLGSVGAGMYMRKTGKYYRLALGSGVLALAGISNIVLVTPSIGIARQYTLLIPSGLAYSSILTVTLLSLISAVPSSHQAGTTSIAYMFRATGSTLGVSIASAIFKAVLDMKLSSDIPRLVKDAKLAEKIIQRAAQDANYVNEAPAYVRETLRQCYHHACKGSLSFAFFCICMGIACSAFMKEHYLHSSVDRE